ncbi:MAG: glutamyl-tRNA reductase [Candidatus Omnitrophica bacterium]|nr:glutamyl-tRNA reductase [Candidatus Omnitrophota bacterium]
MSVIVVGTNHKFSPVNLRESISFTKKSMRRGLAFLKETNILDGAVIVSTCNRVEIYASTEDIKKSKEAIVDFICRYHEVNKSKLLPYLYIYEERTALKHLAEVVSGLDSLIVGETQVLSQVKEAFLESKNANFMSRPLEACFNQAFYIAKKVHRETGVSDGKVSVASIAIAFLKERLGILTDKKMLVIGAGKVTKLILQYIEKEKLDIVFLSNRTLSKARDIAKAADATVVRFDKLKEYFKEADIIITATASPHTIVKRDWAQALVVKKLIMLDLAIPRDVEHAVGELDNIELYCLEDLTAAIEQNRQKREKQAEIASHIIDEEIDIPWQRHTESVQERALLRLGR